MAVGYIGHSPYYISVLGPGTPALWLLLGLLTRVQLRRMNTYITVPVYTENQPLTTISISWQLGANRTVKCPPSRGCWKDMDKTSKGCHAMNFCPLQQAIAVELPRIWKVVTLMCRHCNVRFLTNEYDYIISKYRNKESRCIGWMDADRYYRVPVPIMQSWWIWVTISYET